LPTSPAPAPPTSVETHQPLDLLSPSSTNHFPSSSINTTSSDSDDSTTAATSSTISTFSSPSRRLSCRSPMTPAQHFDCILLDLNMPEMDGIECANWLRLYG